MLRLFREITRMARKAFSNSDSSLTSTASIGFESSIHSFGIPKSGFIVSSARCFSVIHLAIHGIVADFNPDHTKTSRNELHVGCVLANSPFNVIKWWNAKPKSNPPIRLHQDGNNTSQESKCWHIIICDEKRKSYQVTVR